MFTTPCFIRKNTQELREKLEEMGYEKQSNSDIDDPELTITAVLPTQPVGTYDRLRNQRSPVSRAGCFKG